MRSPITYIPHFASLVVPGVVSPCYLLPSRHLFIPSPPAHLFSTDPTGSRGGGGVRRPGVVEAPPGQPPGSRDVSSKLDQTGDGGASIGAGGPSILPWGGRRRRPASPAARLGDEDSDGGDAQWCGRRRKPRAFPHRNVQVGSLHFDTSSNPLVAPQVLTRGTGSCCRSWPEHEMRRLCRFSFLSLHSRLSPQT